MRTGRTARATSHGARSFVLALAVGLLCGACKEEPADTIERQRESWDSKRPAEYVIEICSTGFTVGHCTESAVADGEVVAARSRDTTDDFWTQLDAAKQPEPVDALFDQVDQRREDCQSITVTFDAAYGFVESYVATCGSQTSGQRVTCFAANTTELGACDSLRGGGGAGGAG